MLQPIDQTHLSSVCCGWDMPVTARLSREFYNRFGDKVVNELVGLLNDMDTTFRAELREINDHNIKSFEVKLDQLGAEMRTEMANLRAELIKWMFLFWLGTVATMLSFGRFLIGG